MRKQKAEDRERTPTKENQNFLVALFSTRYSLSSKRSEQGFTLLLAALIASIVLALGISISGIVQKELILSSIGRDSQFAFYAADSAAECALYWDIRHQIFSSETPPSEITCDDQTVPVSVE